MSSEQQYAGYNSIQCYEITSTDKVVTNLRSDTFNRRFPLQRKSYRSCREPQPYPVQNIVPMSTPGTSKDEYMSTSSALACVVIIFLCSVFTLFLVYANFPALEENEKIHIKIPWNIEEAKHLGTVLYKYKDDHWLQVLAGIFVTYIFLQTFAIPGSLFLSILSGFLFPFFLALLLVCTCSAIGASLCFMLSQLLGRRLVLKYFPERAAKWAVIVNKHRDNLFNYVVFLRVTPFLPNWFINLTAPVIGVPLVPFITGTFVGVAPPSVVAIQAGQTLHSMSATDATFSWTSIVLLSIFAIISLIPVFMKERLKRKFE